MHQQNEATILAGTIKKAVARTTSFLHSVKDKSRNARKLLFKAGLWRTLTTYLHYIRHNNKPFKYHLSLVLCIKDEARYIQEWLEYYLLLGVDHFYIYNNNGTDNTREVIDSYIQDEIATWHEHPGVNQQRTIYNNAIKNYRTETQWMGFIDIDEFIVPLKHQTIPKVLECLGNYHQLLIHWIMYGSSHHKHYSPDLVIERFMYRQEGATTATKAIVNPRSTVLASVHRHIVLGRTVNEKKHIVHRTIPETASADLIRINHYMIKSREEYLGKAGKGEVSTTKYIRDDAFFNMNDKNDIHDTIMDKYVPVIKANIFERNSRGSHCLTATCG